MAKNTRQVGFGVIGLGRFGSTLAQTLAEAGQDVLVIDSNEAKIREARSYTDAAFVTDRLDRETLMECGVQNCDTVVVAIGELIDTSILTTLMVVQLGVRRVIAKAISHDHGAVLEKLGAEVVYPEADMAMRLAKKLTTKRVLDFLSISKDVEISELELSGRLVGQTVANADLRRKYGLNIIAIVGADGNIVVDITPSRAFQAGDAVVVIGKKESIEQFEQMLARE